MIIEGTVGDATLRSNMNWDAIENHEETKTVLKHWQKLGQFRANHPAIGAGIHQMITAEPYVFYRSYQKEEYKDLVVVGLDLPTGEKSLDVSKIFKDGDLLFDRYSNQTVKVSKGSVKINSEYNVVLIETR